MYLTVAVTLAVTSVLFLIAWITFVLRVDQKQMTREDFFILAGLSAAAAALSFFWPFVIIAMAVLIVMAIRIKE